jgi:hypothetical protein
LRLANEKNGVACQVVVVGCSQSVLFCTIAEPSITSVSTDCLCEWVDRLKNFAPAGTVQVPSAIAVDPGPGGISILELYVT